MALHNETGKKGEQVALKYLMHNGYRILATNWQYKKFEIDLIAQIGDELIFVEVKTRKNKFFGEAKDAVTPKKQQHLIEGAEHYMEQNDLDAEARFDVICVYYDINHPAEPEVEHIVDAFGAEW
ncbi:MAG TPA: YraN family protein [Flavobacteriales bacterium]|nr:YraN family protein [Flavobacteriales bacterium]|tara:strand:+ start:81048 stop:81419 length:372 start_codon:yes stop_codon:yes gene_type:complete